MKIIPTYTVLLSLSMDPRLRGDDTNLQIDSQNSDCISSVLFPRLMFTGEDDTNLQIDSQIAIVFLAFCFPDLCLLAGMTLIFK